MIQLISSILFLIIGIFIGYLLNHGKPEELRREIKLKLNKLNPANKPGPVRAPTAEHLREKGGIIEATKDAMRESLDKDQFLHENIPV